MSSRSSEVLDLVSVAVHLLGEACCLFSVFSGGFSINCGTWGLHTTLKVAGVKVGSRQDFLEVLSLGEMVERDCFDRHHLSVDLGVVLKFAVLTNVSIDLVILSDNFDPYRLSNAVAFAITLTLVDKFRTEAVKAIVRANSESPHIILLLIRKPYSVFWNSINSETDINYSLTNEDDFVYLIKLFINMRSGLFKPWLKILENLQHKLSVLLIFPCVLPLDYFSLQPWFEYLECVPKWPKKIMIQILYIKLVLNFIWNLTEQSQFSFFINCLISVS